MPLYNYSSLRKRDKKIYSVAGTQVSSTGISVTWLKVVAPTTIITTLIGALICVILGKKFMVPLHDDWNTNFTLFAVGSGLGIGLALWYIKVQTYRLYEYLIAYLKPKKTYHNLNTREIEYKLYKIKTDAIVQSDL